MLLHPLLLLFTPASALPLPPSYIPLPVPPPLFRILKRPLLSSTLRPGILPRAGPAHPAAHLERLLNLASLPFLGDDLPQVSAHELHPHRRRGYDANGFDDGSWRGNGANYGQAAPSKPPTTPSPPAAPVAQSKKELKAARKAKKLAHKGGKPTVALANPQRVLKAHQPATDASSGDSSSESSSSGGSKDSSSNDSGSSDSSSSDGGSGDSSSSDGSVIEAQDQSAGDSSDDLSTDDSSSKGKGGKATATGRHAKATSVSKGSKHRTTRTTASPTSSHHSSTHHSSSSHAKATSAAKQRTDCDVLAALYSALAGVEWVSKTGWDGAKSNSTGCCTAYGVGCNEAGRVRTLDLAGNGLRGPLDDEVFELQYLQRLCVHQNIILIAC